MLKLKGYEVYSKETKSKRIGIYFAIYIGRRQKKVIIIDIYLLQKNSKHLYEMRKEKV